VGGLAGCAGGVSAGRLGVWGEGLGGGGGLVGQGGCEGLCATNRMDHALTLEVLDAEGENFRTVVIAGHPDALS